jgi:N-methylhydantoinase A
LVVTLGSDILREVREFERGSTATLNGYVQPIVSRYLGRLSQNLRSAGLSNELLVMQGNGGMMAAGTAVDFAVHTVLSGPAAGAIAAARIGAQAGYPNLVACDMGGTSFDVSLIAAGEPALYKARFDIELPEMTAMLVNVRTTGIGRRAPVDLAIFASGVDGPGAPKPNGARQVRFNGGWFDTAIDDRASLGRAAKLAGPAIVEQPDTTVVIDPGATAIVDSLGNLVISVGAA